MNLEPGSLGVAFETWLLFFSRVRDILGCTGIMSNFFLPSYLEISVGISENNS